LQAGFQGFFGDLFHVVFWFGLVWFGFSAGELTLSNGISLFLACPMCNKSDDDRTGGPLAQLAIRAGYIVALLCRANDTFPTLGSIKGIRRSTWDHRNYGSSL